MLQLTSPKVIKNIIDKHGFRFTKSLGQNFLIDQNIVDKILEGAAISQEDKVLEVGPGIGTLTRELAVKAGRVVAVEIDKGLLPILQETVADLPNLTILNDDILKMDIKGMVEEIFAGGDFKVVANLPYYITTPIIMRFLEEEIPFSSLTVMMQKEVAQRMCAKPGEKEYGALSVVVQYYTQLHKICNVPSSVFMPQPKVDSMVISLNKRRNCPVKILDKDFFFKVVKSAFAQRRKTLLNNLTSGEFKGQNKTDISRILGEVGINPQRRGETLTIEEFAKVANYMVKLD